MVIGIDALVAAIHKESELYRDSKKEEIKVVEGATKRLF